ncbi:hypothetical protein N7451_005827 [Penicillium sp. IBT 35674x]|nr:hypothetical protein N7451_005827 [Penicillium sp. IBT 35674x]
MGRTLWLDGLRGVAAAIVAIFHAKELEPDSIFGFLSRSFWDEPPNRIAGLSSFHLSDCFLPAMQWYLCSWSYRATLFLFQSCHIAIMELSFSTSWFLYFCNVYQVDLPDDWVGGLKPLTAPWSHLRYVSWTLVHMMDISNHGADLNFTNDRPELDCLLMQLWTMAIEFRGSCIVYLLIMTSAFWRSQPRYLMLLGLAIYWFLNGHWDIFAFIIGLCFAESQVGPEEAEADGELALPCHTTKNKAASIRALINIGRKIIRDTTKSVKFRRIRTSASLVIGVYLLCISHIYSPPSGFLAPEYRYLLAMQPSIWDNPEMAPRCWSTVGAVLVVYAIGQSKLLQRPLESQLGQYLGKISFPLYLVHLTVYWIFKPPFRNLIWWIEMGQAFPGTIEASQNGLAFWVAWIGSILVSGVIMVALADLWGRFIDVKCLKIGKRFEKWATQST